MSVQQQRQQQQQRRGHGPHLLDVLRELPLPGIVIGVDRLLDMCRTTVNVWGDMGAARIMTRIAPD